MGGAREVLDSWRARLPERLRDTRSIALLLASILIFLGLVIQLGTPPGGGGFNFAEIPGSVNSLVQQVFNNARPESGYPRIKIERVGIDLRLVRGDGSTPPVKYEAFTYPGADYLLAGSQSGGGNTYVYAHARSGMFWNLHNLHIGDVVVVDYGGGKTLRYRIAEIHPKIFWKDFVWLQPTADDRLTLQTCNGWRDEDPRFIVVARRITAVT